MSKARLILPWQLRWLDGVARISEGTSVGSQFSSSVELRALAARCERRASDPTTAVASRENLFKLQAALLELAVVREEFGMALLLLAPYGSA